MLSADENEDLPEEFHQQLGKILFMKRTITTGGMKRKYVADSSETEACIRELLRRRTNFLSAEGCALEAATKGASQEHYVFNESQRAGVMQQWKDEYHGTEFQIQLQLRDSWKPMPKKKGKGKGKDREEGKGKVCEKGLLWGPNSQAIRSGKHSRFSRHLQRVAGSKTMAELIVFAGNVDLDFLRKAQESSAAASSASQPAASSGAPRSAEQSTALKTAAAAAKAKYRMACMIQRRLDDDKLKHQNLREADMKLLVNLHNGNLLEWANSAIIAFGHGSVRRADGATAAIGGSTGGITRRLLDGHQACDVNDFLSHV